MAIGIVIVQNDTKNHAIQFNFAERTERVWLASYVQWANLPIGGINQMEKARLFPHDGSSKPD